MTEINDDAAINFARDFYQNIFLGTYTIKQAFDNAKSAVKAIQRGEIRTCCCAHVHKPDCKWMKCLKHFQDPTKAHNDHKPNCACLRLKNYHDPDCKFALTFQKKLETKYNNLEKSEDELYKMEEKIDAETELKLQET